MKKLLALTMSVILASAVFVGCSNNDEEKETAESTTEVTTEETTEEVTDETEPELSIPAFESDNALADIVKVALADREWPMMQEIADPELASNLFNIDLANADYENVIIAACPMTAPFAEIVVIKTVDGKAADAQKLLTDRRDELATQQGMYPATMEAIEGSVIATEGNYVFFVAGSNDAQGAADAMIAAVK